MIVADLDLDILLVLLGFLTDKWKPSICGKCFVLLLDEFHSLDWLGDVFALMNELVLLEREATTEGLVANVAFECFNFRVCLLVALQVRDLAESTAAYVALVRFFSCMNSNVLLEMLGEAEAFVAVMAAERALVSVDHLVSMKIF